MAALRNSDSLDEYPEQLILRHMKFPVEFVRDIFGVEPTEQQKQILRAIAEPGAKVSVRSGHGTGKSTVEAWCVFWFLLFNEECKLAATAPSGHQLYDVLWAECAKWHDKMPDMLKDTIEIKTDTIRIKGHERTRFAIARTARRENPDALQGIHATNVMYLIDEASGVDDKVFEVAEGALTSKNARLLMCANPTRTVGYFADSQKKNRKEFKCLHLSCLDSPLVDKSYAESIERRYGKESNIYRVRVLGDFPKSEDDVLIPLDWIESSIGRDVSFVGAKKIAGLDVARFGDDDTAIVVREGQKITYIERWSKADTMFTTGKVADMYKARLFDIVKVDSNGLGGGVVDRLIELGVPCDGVNVSESASVSAKYNRRRDELWWKSREFFENKMCSMPAGNKLIEELVGELSTVKYRYLSGGKIVVESKDEMKKRGLTSPNLADALNLTFDELTNTFYASSTSTIQRRNIVRRRYAW